MKVKITQASHWGNAIINKYRDEHIVDEKSNYDGRITSYFIGTAEDLLNYAKK